jgi:hypothetical protein
MKKQDAMSVMITFVVGFLAGGYLYISHFSKIIQPDTVQTQDQSSEFTIVSEAYGSCGDVCPSFQVVKDGSYRYQFTPAIGQEKTIKSGTLPLDVQRALKHSLLEEELVAQSQPIAPSDCNSRNNAIDIRYSITLEGAEYTLDSCGTNIKSAGTLWEELSSIWTYLQSAK